MRKLRSEVKDSSLPEDFSPKIHQKSKFSKELNIKELPWTEKQQQFIKLALDKNTKIIFVDAPAGTSKTVLAVFSCLKLLSDKKISDITYLRSAVESSKSKLGFLPGTVEDKLSNYTVPFWDKLDELLNKQSVDELKREARVSVSAPNFIRGLSWNVKGIIFDEAQSSTKEEIFTFLTRIGPKCKIFILGDPSQSDLNKSLQGGFEYFCNVFNDEESRNQGIHVFKFTEDDIIRSDLVKFIVKKLNKNK